MIIFGSDAITFAVQIIKYHGTSEYVIRQIKMQKKLKILKIFCEIMFKHKKARVYINHNSERHIKTALE